MHWMIAGRLPSQVNDKGERTKIFDNEIPIRVDARPTALRGTLWWVGSPGASKLPLVIAAIVIVLGGGGLVLWLRRRRGGDDDGASIPTEGAVEAW